MAASESGRVDAWSVEIGGVRFRCLVLDTHDVRVPEILARAEQEIVEGVLRGWSNARIARERGTSVRTVANQIAVIFRKLEVSSRYELIRVATETST